jgi:hypothetical protein
MKHISFIFALFIALLGFNACEKAEQNEIFSKLIDSQEKSDNGNTARMAMKDDGYTETEVYPIEKIDCYFQEWDKTIMTAVSGLFEYHDSNGTWAASIDFGDGSCDQWVTKTWDVDMFPDHPDGIEEFSLFE